MRCSQAWTGTSPASVDGNNTFRLVQRRKSSLNRDIARQGVRERRPAFEAGFYGITRTTQRHRFAAHAVCPPRAGWSFPSAISEIRPVALWFPPFLQRKGLLSEEPHFSCIFGQHSPHLCQIATKQHSPYTQLSSAPREVLGAGHGA